MHKQHEYTRAIRFAPNGCARPWKGVWKEHTHHQRIDDKVIITEGKERCWMRGFFLRATGPLQDRASESQTTEQVQIETLHRYDNKLMYNPAVRFKSRLHSWLASHIGGSLQRALTNFGEGRELRLSCWCGYNYTTKPNSGSLRPPRQ